MKAGDAGGAPNAAGWEQAASKLRGARPGRDRDESCQRVVDELSRAVGLGAGGAPGLKKGSQMLSRLLAGLDYDTCAKVLQASLGRIYVTPENCVALGGLFGSIGRGGDADTWTRITLEIVRVSLLLAYVRRDALGASAGAVLNSCYGALLSVASQNKLEELERIMKEKDTRDAFCGKGSGVASMARLWRLIRAMHDIPDRLGIHDVLRRYPKLKALSDKPRLKRARTRITQFAQHVAADSIMHEDYGVIYNLAYESNVRISYWLSEVYAQHGGSGVSPLSDPRQNPQPQSHDRGWVRMMVAARYLILELECFRSWERFAYKKIVKRLDVENPDAITRIIERRKEMEEAIKGLRRVSGAHIDWPFSKVRARIDEIGLYSIMRYAGKVLLFQDAAYFTIPHRHYRLDPRNFECREQWLIRGAPDRLKAITAKCGSVHIKLSMDNADKRRSTHEASLCLRSIYDRHLQCSGVDESPRGGVSPRPAIYSIKYVFLELCNIIEKLEELGLDMPFRPDFFSRKHEYCWLRDNYSAHPHTREVRGLRQILEEKSELLSHIPYDIWELDQVMSKLEKTLPEIQTRGLKHMTEPEVERIAGELNRLTEITHADFGNRFRDPEGEPGRRAMRERYGKEWDPDGVARPGPGAQAASAEGKESPLRRAEEAVGRIGTGKCPAGWLDDLVCGDYAGALARMAVYSWLADGHVVEAAPGCPAGGASRPDMAVGEGEDRCWLAVCALDNVPGTLDGTDLGDAGARRALAADILEAAHRRLAGMGGWRGQAAMVVADPGGAIQAHGGLEVALAAIGREMPWVSALAVVCGGRCEVRGVPNSGNPLRDGVRAMLGGLGHCLRA